MEFIKKVFKPGTNKHYYYVYDAVIKNKKRVEIFVRNATIDEIKAYLSDRTRDDNLTFMVCDNPFCENTFRVTKQEKIQFNLIDPRDKKKLEFQYCSAKCREDHGEQLRAK